MSEKIAIVLGAGGSRAAFEVGAVRCLYNHNIKPNIICGSSGGAINAAKLAEGEGAETQGLKGLELLWGALNYEEDFYTYADWFKNYVGSGLFDVGKQIKDEVVGVWAGNVSSVAIGLLTGSLPVVPILGTINLLKLTFDLHEVSNFIDDLGKQKSFYSLDPLFKKLTDPKVLDLSKIESSDIDLCLATVNLESGLLRLIDKSGNLMDEKGTLINSTKISLPMAIRASASIPVVFEPVKLEDGYYIDGGVRKFIPVKSAVDRGAATVYAIGTAAINGYPADSFATKGVMDIAARALTDIMPSEIQLDNLNALKGWDANIIPILPIVDLYNSLDVDPGLVQIAIDYGYMRAFEVAFGNDRDEQTRKKSAELADKITTLRLAIWQAEITAGEFWPHPKFGEKKGELSSFNVPTAQDLIDVRLMKRELVSLIAQRHELGGEFPGGDYPNSVKKWYQSWEKHYAPDGDLGPTPPNPWNERYGYITGPEYLASETPPDVPVPQMSISISITNGLSITDPQTVVINALDNILSPPLSVNGTVILEDSSQHPLNQPFQYTIPFGKSIKGIAKSANFPDVPITIVAPLRKLNIKVTPFPVTLDEPIDITIFADDNGAPISAKVTIVNPGEQPGDNNPKDILTNIKFNYVFRALEPETNDVNGVMDGTDTNTGKGNVPIKPHIIRAQLPTGTINASGYKIERLAFL